MSVMYFGMADIFKLTEEIIQIAVSLDVSTMYSRANTLITNDGRNYHAEVFPQHIFSQMTFLAVNLFTCFLYYWDGTQIYYK